MTSISVAYLIPSGTRADPSQLQLPPKSSLPLTPQVAKPVLSTTPLAAKSSPAEGQVDDESIQEYVTDPLSESIVRVYVSNQEIDVAAPWRKKGVEISQIAGAVITGDRILVTAHSILDATYIEMSRFGDSRRYELTVEYVDQEVNLALLKLSRPNGGVHLTPLEIDNAMPVRAQADVMAWQSGQMTRTRVRISDITMRKARTSTYDVASYYLDVRLQNYPAPLPLVRRGRLTGLINEIFDSSAVAVPATIIRHFVDDAATGSYRGFAGLGIDTAPLVAPDARAYFKAQDTAGGVRVVRVLPDGPLAGLLRPNDILIKVSGRELDEYGRYHHPFWGRVSYKYLLNELHGGDHTAVTILRNGQSATHNVTLARFDSKRGLVRPWFREGMGQQPYLIVAGLLLTELDRPMLETWGSNWQGTAPVEFVLADRRQNTLRKGGTVVLSHVLADPVNQGYADLANQLVSKINGHRVESIADVAAALAQPVVHTNKRYIVISLSYDQGLIVLPYDDLIAAHKRIATKYGIEPPEAFFTPKS